MSFRQRKQIKIEKLCEQMINHCFLNYSFIPTRSSMPQSRIKRDQEVLCRFSKSKIRSNVFSLTLWHPWNHWIPWSSLLFPDRWSYNGIPRLNWSLRSHPQLLRVFFLRIWRKMVIWSIWNYTYVMVKFLRNCPIKCNFRLVSADFPFITYYLINKQNTDPVDFYNEVQCAALRKFDPRDLRYAANHTLDLFNEVATIARPPLEPPGVRPPIPSTGYIVSIFKVFEGDDGLKFEQNWLYWTGTSFTFIRIYYIWSFIL